MNDINLSYINNHLGAKMAQTKYGSMIAICIPKDYFNDISSNYLQDKSGIYFLMNSLNIYSNHFKIYVGKSSELENRVNSSHKNNQHNDIKWEYSLVFFRSDSNKQFNSDEIAYLEQKTYKLLQKNGFSYNLINDVPNGTKRLDLMNVNEINENPLKEIKIYSDALGFPLFFINKIMCNKQNDYTITSYRLKNRDAKGNGNFVNNGNRFIVFHNSIVTYKKANKSYLSKHHNNYDLISKLLERGIIHKNNNGGYIFIKDYVFTSPSQAASFLEQSEVSGPNHWGINSK